MIVRAALLLFILTPIVAQADPDPYRIGVDDLLQVQVWSRPDLSGQVPVEPSGEIQLPLVGSVPAANRTPEELSAELSRRYGILDAKISEVIVTVAEYRSRSVTVVGEVKNPGRYSFQTIPNLWEILLAAGGPTSQADLAQVQIVRKDKVGDEPPTVTVDLSAGLEGTKMESLPAVRPRDTVLISSLGGEPSAAGESFQILGAVAKPGVYKIGSASSLIEALAVSGGPLQSADLSKVRLTRPTPKGVAAYELDVEGHLYRGDPLTDMHLKSGDTITVPTSRSVDVGTVVTRIIGLTSIITAVSTLIIALNN
ncbi:MAG TPA: polysaccharide biosynthesis/export family protein [Dongiaceae bacterium]|jgi:polysaccharide export outer membrane protein|nr:polysaccharide biosynthesis/export family protein [Dongiaceae bacterium]